MQDTLLLINPAINPASQNNLINATINKMFPTCLGALAGYVMAEGNVSVRIVDEQIDFIEDENIEELILSLKEPRIIGVSVLTISSKRAYTLANKIKKIDSKATVIFGGIHPTVLTEEVLKQNSVDVVVRGEGEETLHELIENIFHERNYSTIQGISFRQNDTIIHTPERPMIVDLDRLPPFPYDLFEKNRQEYTSFGVLLASRGCPYNCIFCSSRNVSGKKYRYYSIDRILSEITLLVEKYNQKTIWLLDDNIASNKKQFKALLDAIIEADLPSEVNFHGSMRGDDISDEILDKAKAANFMMIGFGLETGSESLMKVINKGETVQQVTDAITMVDRKGIAVGTTIIFGLPGETRQDRWNTMRLVRSLPLSSVRFNTLAPYPGTPAFDMLNKKGEVFIKKDWENFAVQYMWESDDIPYVPQGNDRYELIFDTMYANLSYYLSVNGIKKMLKMPYAGGNVINLPSRWYFSYKTIWKFIKVFLYVIRRFFYIFFKMHIYKTKRVFIKRFSLPL